MLSDIVKLWRENPIDFLVNLAVLGFGLVVVFAVIMMVCS